MEVSKESSSHLLPSFPTPFVDLSTLSYLFFGRMLRSLPRLRSSLRYSSTLKSHNPTSTLAPLVRRPASSSTASTRRPLAALSSPSSLLPLLRLRSTMAPTTTQTPSSTRFASTSTSPSSSSENWSASTHPAHPTLSFLTFDLPLEQSPLDDRKYKLIRLENGLEALLIQDDKTDKSTAAMDVKVGHLMDPVSTEVNSRLSLVLARV